MISFTSTPDLVDAFFEQTLIVDAGLFDFGGYNKFFGEIHTVYCYEDSTHVAASLDSPGQGKVLIVDGGASLRMALTGDQVLSRGIKNGWAGVILNGCVRDKDIVRTLNIGVKALGSHPGKRIRRGDGKQNVSVNFKGVTFNPGDFVFSDETGTIVIPRKIALENIVELQLK